MTTPAPTAEPTQADDPAADDASFQQTLRALIDAGAKLVQDLLADPATPPADKAEPYERFTRAIRRSIALARHIAANPPKRAQPDPERRAQARRQVIRDVENAIAQTIDRPEPAESLRDELNERLDDPEFDRDLATRPIQDIIRDLKRDLGLEPNRYPRRTPADIHDLNARATAPTKPPDPDEPDLPYEPGHTRPNPLLARYREAADG